MRPTRGVLFIRIHIPGASSYAERYLHRALKWTIFSHKAIEMNWFTSMMLALHIFERTIDILVVLEENY
jgi:hypothetical protein